MNKLLSTVFHEVRNPLGVINLHAELIRKNPANAAQSAEIISRTSLQLEKLLTEFLNCTKPVALEKTDSDLEKTLNCLISLIKPSCEERNIKLVYKNNLTEDAKAAHDGAKLNQVMFNLVKNALEASKPGKKLEITLENDHNNILIKISDQGTGIPKENREKVFQPYFTTKKQGTGIGLFQSRQIIEAHGGNLLIDPEKTRGITFIIQLRRD